MTFRPLSLLSIILLAAAEFVALSKGEFLICWLMISFNWVWVWAGLFNEWEYVKREENNNGASEK